jgi:hypothetical protein
MYIDCSFAYDCLKNVSHSTRFAKFYGIVTVESFAASAMGLTVGAIAPTTEAAMALGPWAIPYDSVYCIWRILG